MNKLKVVLSAIAVVSAVGGVFATKYNALTNRFAFPQGTGYSTIGGNACQQVAACAGGDFVCVGIRPGTTSTLTTLRSSDSFASSHCGQQLGRQSL